MKRQASRWPRRPTTSSACFGREPEIAPVEPTDPGGPDLHHAACAWRSPARFRPARRLAPVACVHAHLLDDSGRPPDAHRARSRSPGSTPGPAVSSPIGLLPGWEIRYDRSRRKFEKGRQYCLSLGKKLAGSVATASATTVEFPYKRVARLRAPRAAAAYASFVGFQARGAFDHDFAKGIDMKSEQMAPSPSDES